MNSRDSVPFFLDLLQEFPAVAILGPRQVGKTTLAHQLCVQWPGETQYLDLELPSDQARLQDAEAYLGSLAGKLVVLDEVQRMPELFAMLRGLIDQRRRAGLRTGQFLLLGSASGTLLQQSSESLAGRIAYRELYPLQLHELESTDVAARDRLWLRGGFPESLLARSDAASQRWRSQFITTYLERDIPQLGPRIPATTLRRFWTMLAHEQGQLLNASRLATSLAVSGQTITRYLDLMSDLMLVRRLQPWAGNSAKRLVRSPKIYVRDTGVLHSLLGINSLDALLAHPVAGSSWEGMVIEHLIAALPEGAEASFYRTSAGAEIDLVLELPGQQRWAVEIKRSGAPAISKGFHLGAEDIGATHKWVVYGGSETYPLGEGVKAVPLEQLQAVLRKVG